jgi:4-diphosphocytidyl-2-C-methyl-D-erythritol kinase
MDKLTLNSPAKINIGLNIVSKRNDGFHNLETFFYPIYDLHDKLIFEFSNNYIFDSNNTDLVKDPDNLISKAHTLLEEFTKKKIPVKITLIKNIPIGAGLGGGSSNAASTLVGINEMFKLGINENDLLELALQLGSDVPFFIKAKPAIGKSRGEILTQCNTYFEEIIVIVNPGIHVSTKEAFKYIKPKSPEFDYNYFLDREKIDYEYIRNNVSNDFEENIFSSYPEIENIKNIFFENGALFSMMSGTGSTVYGIMKNEEDAEKVLNELPDNYFKFISKV